MYENIRKSVSLILCSENGDCQADRDTELSRGSCYLAFTVFIDID